MADDTEKRFHTIMDKLFQSPKSNLPISSSSTNENNTRGQKRPFSAMELNSKGSKGGSQNTAHVPQCRPWDRGDLMRRAATFKSMRWFAKPKAVDAINCARRGWINVDVDIIGCEVCGARLQFSTPSAWNQQQVEKAALVFSLKLDSGHKLLCPWIDNACDEKLALFPPMPLPVLVDHYKQRSSALLQLSALPVISTSVVESMKSPELEHFLKQSIDVECGHAPKDSSWTEFLGNSVDVVSADLYYQAHRLLSLCGWEPRLLPYIVDCENQPKLSSSNENFSHLSHGTDDVQSNKLSVCVSGSSGSIRADEDLDTSSVYYDPNSVVLDCKLCGASIGLWAFTMVPRPLELVRVVGFAELGSGGEPEDKHTANGNHANGKSDIASANEENLSNKRVLNLTIAGGPPPTKQNFRAKISLPIIGRNVKARLSCLSSDVKSGDDEAPASMDTQNVEIESGVCASKTQDNTPSATADDIDNLQDTTALREEISSIPSGEEKRDRVGDVENTASLNEASTVSIEKDMTRHLCNNKTEFHPIKQHRHFCPWVSSTKNITPGWKQTLSALQKEKVFSLPESECSPSSPSLIMVDDPITSIRRLFESPPAKKRKLALT